MQSRVVAALPVVGSFHTSLTPLSVECADRGQSEDMAHPSAQHHEQNVSCALHHAAHSSARPDQLTSRSLHQISLSSAVVKGKSKVQ